MQDHLKERITGAAILVVVVVLLVPEMFRGPPPTGLRSGTAAAGGPPVRSYTIDLRDSAEAASPAASAPVLATPPAAADTTPAKETVNALTVPSASAPTRAVNPPPPAARAATPAAGQPGAALKSGWTVQVGSFARRDYAERMVKQMAAKGFTVEVAGPDDHGLFRVRSAPQPQHATALALKQKMQASGLKPIINTVP